ncbi:MAG: DUF4129 domain-containing protein [Anaerolineae bacterium]
MSEQQPGLNVRQEVMSVALAAAEVCWLAPLFVALNQASAPHEPLLLSLGMLVLLLGFFYVYRAVVAAGLPLRLQQGVVALVLLLAIGLFLRYHVYAAPEWRGESWIVSLFRSLADVDAVQPGGWVAVISLVYLWARGIHLARRSLSLQSVSFSFRAGVVILILGAVFLHFLSEMDAGGFAVAYFFFALLAVALARIEEVSQVPNSSRTVFSGFWIGSTLASVGLLVLLGLGVALFFSGGGLQRVIDWAWPAVIVAEMILVAIGVLLLAIVEAVLGLFSVDISTLGLGFRQALARLGEALTLPTIAPPPGANPDTRPPILGVAQVVLAVGIPLAIVGLVLLLTWYRQWRTRRGGKDEARESTFSAGALARGLQAALEDGLARLGELAGMVDRFGVGSRFLAALSVRRIYANVVRLATDAGYPRARSQTPYEYLHVLNRALPERQEEVSAITEAYVAAHYGQVPDSREELAHLRACWQRIRAGGIEKR